MVNSNQTDMFPTIAKKNCARNLTYRRIANQLTWAGHHIYAALLAKQPLVPYLHKQQHSLDLCAHQHN